MVQDGTAMTVAVTAGNASNATTAMVADMAGATTGAATDP
jgi:hypothetical protein